MNPGSENRRELTPMGFLPTLKANLDVFAENDRKARDMVDVSNSDGVLYSIDDLKIFLQGIEGKEQHYGSYDALTDGGAIQDQSVTEWRAIPIVSKDLSGEPIFEHPSVEQMFQAIPVVDEKFKRLQRKVISIDSESQEKHVDIKDLYREALDIYIDLDYLHLPADGAGRFNGDVLNYLYKLIGSKLEHELVAPALFGIRGEHFENILFTQLSRMRINPELSRDQVVDALLSNWSEYTSYLVGLGLPLEHLVRTYDIYEYEEFGDDLVDMLHVLSFRNGHYADLIRYSRGSHHDFQLPKLSNYFSRLFARISGRKQYSSEFENLAKLLMITTLENLVHIHDSIPEELRFYVTRVQYTADFRYMAKQIQDYLNAICNSDI